MAIKEVITLEGVEQVKAQLKDLGATGEASLDQFRQIGGTGQTNPFDSLVKNAQEAGLSLGEVEKHGNSLAEAIHVLHPILQIAGVRLGELNSFARLAGVGIAGLAAAAVGVATVAFAKLEEAAARTRGQLDDLFRGQGQVAFAAIDKQASQFGTTVAGLVPGIESLKRALDAVADTKGFVALNVGDLPGVSRNIDKVATSYGNFIKILRAGRLDQAEAEKTAKAFFDTFKDGGPLTVQALQALPVGTLQLLQQALGRGAETAKTFFAEVKGGNITIDQINNALTNFSAQSDTAFDTKAIKTFGDEFNKLLQTLSRGFSTLTGTTITDFLSNQLKLFREDIQAIVDLIDSVQQKIARSRLVAGGPGLFVGPTLEQAKLAAGPQGDLATSFFPSPEQAGKAGGEAAKSFGKGFVDNLNVGGGPGGVGLGKDFIDNVNTSIKAATEETPVDIPVTPALPPDKVEALRNELLTPLTNAPVPALDLSPLLDGFKAGGTAILQVFQDVYNGAVALFSQPIPASIDLRSSLQSTAPFAAGGMVRGAGSTTSDSILALLSNREFVVNARAVSHYGPEFFAALNAMRLPRDFMSRFSMGGLARAISGNRFAAGGQVQSSQATSTLVLNIGGRSFEASANEATITSLRRFAVNSQLASIGRKPGFVR